MNQPKKQLTTSGKILLIFLFLAPLLLVSTKLFLLGVGLLGAIFFVSMFNITIKK
jgi:hypothetical protein